VLGVPLDGERHLLGFAFVIAIGWGWLGWLRFGWVGGEVGWVIRPFH